MSDMPEFYYNGEMRLPLHLTDANNADLAPDSTPTFEIFDGGVGTPIRTALNATLITGRPGHYWLTEQLTAANSANYVHGHVYTVIATALSGAQTYTKMYMFRISIFVLRECTLTGGSTTTGILDSAASSVDDEYKGAAVLKIGSAGRFEAPRSITGCVGSTQTFTVQRAWNSAAANGNKCYLLPIDNGMADAIAIPDADAANWVSTIHNNGSAVAGTTILDNFAGGSASAVSAAVVAAIGVTPTAQNIATTLLTLANGVETGITLQEAIRGIAAVMLGKASGFSAGNPSTGVFRAANDSKVRVTANVDASGNRSVVTKDLT